LVVRQPREATNRHSSTLQQSKKRRVMGEIPRKPNFIRKKWIPTTTTTTFKDDYRTSELIQKLLPMHVVPVLTKAKKLYNTKRLFYITLNTGLISKRCAPHDFQRMFTAAERYMSASLRRKIQEIHMENLLPPPAQFADPKDDKKLWKWRMERKKTVTLYHISK